MNVSTTVGAGEAELGQSPFELGLRLQQLESEHLRRDRDRVICGDAGVHRLVDDLAGLARLLGDRDDRSLEDGAVRRRHDRMLCGDPDPMAFVGP
jgi:hypothetical protein